MIRFAFQFLIALEVYLDSFPLSWRCPPASLVLAGSYKLFFFFRNTISFSTLKYKKELLAWNYRIIWLVCKGCAVLFVTPLWSNFGNDVVEANVAERFNTSTSGSGCPGFKPVALFPLTRNFIPLCLSSPRCINRCRRHTAGGATLRSSNIPRYSSC